MEEGQSATTLAHRFELRRRLGEGGMGVVYEALDRERDSLVALKVMRHVDPVALYRFKKEFRALADIHHPNLVAIYELLTLADDWFFTMELVDGVSFLDFVYPTDRPAQNALAAVDSTASALLDERSLDRLETEATRRLKPEGQPLRQPARRDPVRLDGHHLRAALGQLAEGVYALHRARRLHRDLKPSNVLVTAEGRVVILDFGLVSELSQEGDALTLHDSLAGTVAYMSPEQAANLKLTEASDWYSVGVILYEALTGRLPIAGPRNEVLHRKQRETPTPPEELNRGAPKDLCDICVRLLSIRPENRPRGAKLLAALGRTPQDVSTESTFSTRAAPFVGREQEMDALERAFEDTRRGSSVTVFVSGKSGAGKTALLRRFADLASARWNALVLPGRCFERESVPYKAFDSLIDALSAHLATLSRESVNELAPPGIAALSRLFPVLRRVQSIERPLMLGFDVADPQEFRRRAFVALRELLSRIAETRALVLTIDDLQWGDLDSGRLILELLRPPDPPPVLLLASYRSEEAEASPLLRLLLDPDEGVHLLGDVRDLTVEALGDAQTQQLAEVLLGAADPSTLGHADAIARESAGNPFLVGELVRYVLSGGDLENLSIASLLEFRLRKLPEGARKLLAAISVAGHPIELGAVRRATGLGAEIRDLVVNLRVDHMVRTMGLRDSDHIETYHDRLREVVVDGMGADTLTDWHLRLAHAYEEIGNADPEVLMEHWEGAGDAPRAGAHAVAAAEQAEAAYAFDRAGRLYERALSLLGERGEETRKLRVKQGDALANAGRGEEAADAFLGALEGATAAEKLELRRRAAEQLLHTGHFDRGLEAVSAVLDAVGVKLARTPKRALLSLVRRRLWLRLRGLGYKERDRSQVSDEDLTRIDVLWSVATGLSQIDTLRGADFGTLHLLMSLRGGEPYRIARGLAMESAYASIGGGATRGRALALAEATMELAQRLDNHHAIGLAQAIFGVGAFLRGDWAEARSHCEKGEEVLRNHCTGVAWEMTSAQFFMLGAMYYLGDLAGLARLVPERLREAVERGNLYMATGMRSWRTNVAWLAMDEPDEARRQVELAHRQWTRRGFHLQHYYELLSNCQIDLYQDDADTAFERIAERWPALEKSMLMRVQNVRIEALHLRARCALARTEKKDEARLLETAITAATKIAGEHMRWGDALTSLVLGAVEQRRGNAPGASAHLEEAIEHSLAAGMKLHAAVARYFLARTAGATEPDAVAGALARIRELGARDPEKIAKMLAPGFD